MLVTVSPNLCKKCPQMDWETSGICLELILIPAYGFEPTLAALTIKHCKSLVRQTHWRGGLPLSVQQETLLYPL